MNATSKQNTALLSVSSILVTVLPTLSCVTAYFYSIHSIWFTLVVSLLFGNLYYYCNETHPQIVIMLHFLALHQMRAISLKLKNLFSFPKTPIDDKTPQLQLEDGFNSLVYRDCVSENKYIYLFNQKQRSNDLVIFKDESDNDITESLAPYLGPLQDFHGTVLTPGDFKHKKITIFRDGKINCFKTFEEHEPLKFADF